MAMQVMTACPCCAISAMGPAAGGGESAWRLYAHLPRPLLCPISCRGREAGTRRRSHLPGSALSQRLDDLAIAAIAPSPSRQRYRVLFTSGTGWLAQAVYHHLLTTTSSIAADLDLFVTYRGPSPPLWILPSHAVHLDLLQPSSSTSSSSTSSIVAAIDTIAPDILLHFAAVSTPVGCLQLGIEQTMQVNANEALLQALARRQPTATVIFASTDMVYDGEQGRPYTVHHDPAAIVPINLYGASKLAMERLVGRYFPATGYSLRLSNLVGERFTYHPQYDGEKFLQWLYSAMLAATATPTEGVSKEVVGLKGQEKRSFLDLADLCQIIDTLINRHRHAEDSEREGGGTARSSSSRVFNVGGPDGSSRIELAQTICSLLKQPIEIYPTKEEAQAAADRYHNEEGIKAKKKCVYEMSSPPPLPLDPGAMGPNYNIIQVPRDITMDVHETEEEFQMKFTPLKEAIRKYLHL